jgi:hypothetical protein
VTGLASREEGRSTTLSRCEKREELLRLFGPVRTILVNEGVAAAFCRLQMAMHAAQRGLRWYSGLDGWFKDGTQAMAIDSPRHRSMVLVRTSGVCVSVCGMSFEFLKV